MAIHVEKMGKPAFFPDNTAISHVATATMKSLDPECGREYMQHLSQGASYTFDFFLCILAGPQFKIPT